MGGPGEKFQVMGSKRTKKHVEIDIVDQDRNEKAPKKSLIAITDRNAQNPSFRTSS